MADMSRLELLAEMGFTKDPFSMTNMDSSDFTRIRKVVSMGVKARSMVSIVGERGIGKSVAFRSALRALTGIQPVNVHANDINKLLISDIEQAMIIDLSNEKPRRGREIRARQLRRILGEASRRNDIVLVIEEGHLLHGMTLRSLKRLREMEWMGESNLFSVFILCQSDPMNKQGVAEVRLRSDAVYLRGLSAEEIKSFIGRTVGAVFDQDATETVSRLPNSHNYEDLKAILFKLMKAAVFAGRRLITVDDVVSEFNEGISIKELWKNADVSKSELSKLTGLSLPTVTKMLKEGDEGNFLDSTKEKRKVLLDVLRQYQKNEDHGQAAINE